MRKRNKLIITAAAVVLVVSAAVFSPMIYKTCVYRARFNYVMSRHGEAAGYDGTGSIREPLYKGAYPGDESGKTVYCQYRDGGLVIYDNGDMEEISVADGYCKTYKNGVLFSVGVKDIDKFGGYGQSYSIRSSEECERIAQIRDTGGDISSYGDEWVTDGGVTMLD